MKEFFKKIFRSNNDISKKNESEYYFGEYKLIISNNHVLKNYQKTYPLYDRFLPILCSNFKGLIVDVGANIGDTSIAIFSKNSESFVVGVEPDVSFYNVCISNILVNKLSTRFLGVNKFVLTKRGNYQIDISDTFSTGSVLLNDSTSAENNSVSFSELMSLIPSEKKVKFDILKIDTDGFDWDVINSFVQYYKDYNIKPRFIFFEMQTYLNNIGFKNSNRNQISKSYKSAIENLQKIGYNNFCLFDNFGTPIKITESVEEIFEIDDYIKRSQIYNSHSTIYYIDILAFFDDEYKKVKEAISCLYEIRKD